MARPLHAASALGADLGARLTDETVLHEAVARTAHSSAFPSLAWRPESLAAGHPGLALLFATLDRAEPDCGWDRAGHAQLALAVAAAESGNQANPALFGGLSGLGLAAYALAGKRDRYARLLAAVDAAVIRSATALAARVARAEGCRAADIDVISGLAGMGAYLLGRRGQAGARAALAAALTALAGLLGDTGDPRRWHTPAGLSAESLLETYPGGHHNCGLAHGVPGPLALLSIATIEAVPGELGGQVDGPAIRAAITVAARWLAEHRTADAWGPTWPNAVPLADARDQAGPGGEHPGPGSSRATWCYGSPGVARALWLAGRATGDGELRDLALAAVRAAVARPAQARGITSPTLCHGAAGLLQIVHRFAEDTGLPDLVRARDALLAELVAAYEPEAILGYRNVEPSGARVDQPGMLEGAAGVALALLCAAGASCAWDRALLLA
jgi:lantibiotic biosynthesis protein